MLVIDDEKDVGEIAVQILRGGGAQASLACSGAEALEAFESGRFDLVVTDLGMPGMDGYEVVRRVREQDERVRIVVMTGWGVSVEAEELEARGIDGVVLKPFRVEDLLAKAAEMG